MPQREADHVATLEACLGEHDPAGRVERAEQFFIERVELRFPPPALPSRPRYLNTRARAVPRHQLEPRILVIQSATSRASRMCSRIMARIPRRRRSAARTRA
jgi:hypothetical protein